MHESTAVRVGELDKKDRPAGLPEDTHLVSGTLEGHGALALASEKAKLSAKVVKLERTASGGVDYQLAIFVSEPTPAPAEAQKPAVDPQFEAAVAYFTDSGMKRESAEKQVQRFGVDRVLRMRDKKLDEELEKQVSGNK